MTDNDSLELKKRSRRRLVGGAALALLAAIVLPMVMDQEPSPPAQDIQVTIPDRDADSLLARPIAGRAPQPAEPQVAPAPEEQPPAASSEPPAAAAPATESPSPASAEQSAPLPPAAAARAETAPKPEAPAKAEASTKPPAETRAAASSPAVTDEAARVRALLEGQSGTSVRRDESFVVQVGAFSEADKATSLSSELKRLGYTAYTEKAGQVTRVRIGPFASREQAEKVASKLHASGHKGVVATR